MMWTSVLFPMVLLAAVGHAQLATLVDPNIGDTVAVSFSTDPLGNTAGTVILSTFEPSSTSSSSSQAIPTFTPPLSSGTALPPFPSRPVASGTIIQLSQFSATGYPTSSGTPTGKSNSGTLSNPPVASVGAFASVFVALIGGVVALWAFL